MRSSKRIIHPKDSEYYFKSTIISINSRVGKKAYKHITNDFTEESWKAWFKDNLKQLQTIIEADQIPSIERIDSARNYTPNNCIWLPCKLNVSLGKINELKKQMECWKKYCRAHIQEIPILLREYYIGKYDL